MTMMTKIKYILILLLMSIVFCSCVNQKQCAAYGGEKNRFQHNQRYWIK